MKDDRSPRGAAFKIAALLVVVACAVTGAACYLRTPKTEAAKGEDVPPASTPPRGPFAGWDKPDFVLLLSAQQHGYLLPCGCSSPQFGGLERRYNLIQQLRTERGWTVLPLDLGDVPQKEGPAKLPNVQGLIKYRYSMEALEKMGYLATSFGEYEASYKLNRILDNYALNNVRPAVLAHNLLDRDKHFPWAPDDKRKANSYVGSWEAAQVGAVKVGVLGVIGSHGRAVPGDPKSVAEIIKEGHPNFQFGRADQDIPPALKEMDAAGVAFRVLLYQGPAEKARLLAKAFPQFHVILCLSDADVPPSRPEVANGGATFIVQVGHKGRYVGAVGVKRAGAADKPYELMYQVVELGEEYTTPPAKEAGHPILAIMERYTAELKNDNVLAEYYQNTHRVQVEAMELLDENKKPKYKGQMSEYVGSEVCRKCHKHAYEVWEKSPHSHAYETLQKTRKPGNRIYDGECVVCHVVGFTHRTGFKDDTSPALLKSVGCESCHGPSGLHVKNPNDDALYPLINPWKAKENETPKDREKRLLVVEHTCQKCHDQDNDVHWSFEKWEKGKIVHMTP